MTIIIPTTGPKYKCAWCEKECFVPIHIWIDKKTGKEKRAFTPRKYCDNICENLAHEERGRRLYEAGILLPIMQSKEALAAANKKRWENYKPPKVCKRGHKMKGNNIMIRTSGGRKKRNCRNCYNMRARKYYAAARCRENIEGVGSTG